MLEVGVLQLEEVQALAVELARVDASGAPHVDAVGDSEGGLEEREKESIE